MSPRRWCDVPAAWWPAELVEARDTALALALWWPGPDAAAYCAAVAQLLRAPADERLARWRELGDEPNPFYPTGAAW